MAENVINKLNIEARGDTKQAEQSLDRLGSALQTVQAMMKSFNTDKFGEQLTQATADANNLAQTFKSLTPKQAEQGFNNAIKKATELGRSLRNMSEDDKGYGKKVGDFAYQMGLAQNYLQAFRGSSESAIDSVGRMGDKAEESGDKSLTFGEKFSNACSTINTFATKVDSGMSKVGKTVGFMGKKFVNAISPMRLFNREQMKTTWASSLLGRAFARVTRMFRIMITRMLIRGFISNVREGFQNIAKYSDEVNQAFSRIGQSAHTLYNSVATAFAPLIQAITPYIVKALDLITSAFTKVAELISALTGKSFYIKATKYNYDYAKSLDTSTKSTNKNSKATKKNTKAKRENKSATIGIDRLNVIEPNKDRNTNTNGGSGNGNGNKGANVNDMFDTKPVSKKMKALAKEIKKIAKTLFNPIKEAWDKVGSRVINSWKNALKDVWETIKVIGRDFLTMWKQSATEKIFENIFGVFADLGDTVKNLSSQFRKAWTYNNTGLHIFENIRDVVGIVVKRIKKCAEYTRDWARHLNFSPMLQSIERYTKSLKKLVKGLSDIAGDFYETVVLGISKWVVEKGLPNLIQVFTDFNNKVKWQSLRKAIKVLWEGIENLAESIGDGLIIVLDNLMDAFADLLNSKWFQNLIKAIGNLMKSIKPQYIEWFVKAWLGMKAIKFASGLFGKIAIKLGTVIKYVKLFKRSAVGEKIASAFSGVGGNIKGTFAKVGDILKSSSSSIGTSAGTTMATSMGSAFSTVFAPLVVAGLGVALTLIYDKIRNSAFETGLLNEEQQKYLDKLDEANQKWQDAFGRQKETNQNLLTAKDNASFYKDELDKIVDKNGKIKKGYETQAQFLVDKLNPYLNEDLSIVGDTVKGWKKQNKQIEKQIGLITAKNTLEQNGQSYYDAKQNIGDILKKSKDAGKLSKEAWQNLVDNGFGSSRFDAFSFGDSRTYKTARKITKQFESTYQQIIRYDNLRRAVASGNNKKIEQANKLMNVKLTKSEKDRLAYLVAQSQATGQDLLTLIENDSKLADKTYNGSFSNIAKNGKKAFGTVKKSVDSVPNKKGTKFEATGLDKFKKDFANINKEVSSVPRTVNVEIKAKMSITNFKTVSNATKKIANAVQKGGKVIKTVMGTGGQKYAIVQMPNGKRKKIRTMASGGYPKLGSEFIAGEKGAEFVGNINGKTGVASNQEITGIRDSIEDSSAVQNQILAEQNNLLRALLEKNTDIVLDGEKVTKKVNKINARKGYSMAT